MMMMVGIAAIVALIPLKYIIMTATLYLFATNSQVYKNFMASDSGNRRLKEWWDSIPVIPVELVDEPEE